jgi:hypothetical protein
MRANVRGNMYRFAKFEIHSSAKTNMPKTRCMQSVIITNLFNTLRLTIEVYFSAAMANQTNKIIAWKLGSTFCAAGHAAVGRDRYIDTDTCAFFEVTTLSNFPERTVIIGCLTRCAAALPPPPHYCGRPWDPAEAAELGPHNARFYYGIVLENGSNVRGVRQHVTFLLLIQSSID